MPVGITYSTVRVEIHDARLFAPGGPVYQWAVEVRRDLRVAAKGLAPPTRSMSKWGHKGTGNLREAIRADVYQIGTEQLGIDLYVDEAQAYYAKYVLNGTAYQGTRYIYSTGGWANKKVIDEWYRKGLHKTGPFPVGLAMGPLPPGPGGTFPFHFKVRGQKANPFITDAYWLISRRRRELPRIDFARRGGF
jgi:hypothetical protein